MNINKISGFCLIGTGVYAIGIVWLGILLIQSSQEIQKKHYN